MESILNFIFTPKIYFTIGLIIGILVFITIFCEEVYSENKTGKETEEPQAKYGIFVVCTIIWPLAFILIIVLSIGWIEKLFKILCIKLLDKIERRFTKVPSQADHILKSLKDLKN